MQDKYIIEHFLTHPLDPVYLPFLIGSSAGSLLKLCEVLISPWYTDYFAAGKREILTPPSFASIVW